jgi:hypothetical protein
MLALAGQIGPIGDRQYGAPMTFARIFRPSKTAMQSGRAKTNVWCLEFESDAARTADPLMGWTSSTDTQGQVRLTFDSREDAIAYAQQNGLAFQVTDTKDPKRIPRAYSDNFATNRKMPWSH